MDSWKKNLGHDHRIDRPSYSAPSKHNQHINVLVKRNWSIFSCLQKQMQNPIKKADFTPMSK